MALFSSLPATAPCQRDRRLLRQRAAGHLQAPILHKARSHPRPVLATGSGQHLTEKELLCQQLLNFSYHAQLPEGHLTIKALRVEWLPRTADVLTEAFVSSTNIQPYRRFLRRNIGLYLEEHIQLPPLAVVLMALLQPGPAAPGGDLAGGGGQTAPQPRGVQQQMAVLPAVRPAFAAAVAGQPADEQQLAPSQQQQQQQCDTLLLEQAPGQGGALQPGLSSAQQDMQEAWLTALAMQRPDASTVSGSNGSQGGSDGAGLSAASSNSRRGTAAGGGGSDAGAAPAAVLVGTAEVSLDARTRSLYLTLNPPNDCAYLCNVAVDPAWRRKGIARHLLAAAEDVGRLAGCRDMYLHLRFQDDTPERLYKSAGFVEDGKDMFWVKFFGKDQRYLMRKTL